MGPTPGFSGQAARYRFIVRALDKHSPGTIQSAWDAEWYSPRWRVLRCL